MVAAHRLRLTECDLEPVFHAAASLREMHGSLRETARQMFESLHNVQLQVEQSQRELHIEREAFASQRAKLAVGQNDGNLQQSHDHQQLQQQHAAVQAELQSLRTQSEEMAKTIAIQQQQINHERAQWTGELSQMRRILDKQASWLQERTETVESAAALQQFAGECLARTTVERPDFSRSID